jgi:hypothetical protein
MVGENPNQRKGTEMYNERIFQWLTILMSTLFFYVIYKQNERIVALETNQKGLLKCISFLEDNAFQDRKTLKIVATEVVKLKIGETK